MIEVGGIWVSNMYNPLRTSSIEIYFFQVELILGGVILCRLDIVDDFPFSVRSLDRYKRLTRLLLLSIIYIGILFNFFFFN